MKKIQLILALLFLSGLTFGQDKEAHKQLLKNRKAFEKVSDYVYIPSGEFTMGATSVNGPGYGPNGETVRARNWKIESFYMMKFEMSNHLYLSYVKELYKSDSLRAETAMPDTLVWNTKMGDNNKYVDYYLRHPAYESYPVLGVSYNQAVAYADWFTEQYNRRTEKEFKEVKFRLPTEEEWEYAARGGLELSNYP
ncbi:MAG: SUMF1/EgtB/PvdO family nonheme iron enzyme, partial [Crocinitomicaceae bacterium]|nr:SUMF1/EgtB/PvdO family nonheme iron enzyme [Crocinitomicaceae bacterium]